MYTHMMWGPKLLLFKEQSFTDVGVVDLLEDADLAEGGSTPLF